MLDYLIIYLAIGLAFTTVFALIALFSGKGIDSNKAFFAMLMWPVSAIAIVLGVVLLAVASVIDGFNWIARRFRR